MRLLWVPLFIGLMPVLAANISYIVSSQLGHIPSCIPYLQGCTSISSAGRAAPEAFIFKGIMIPSAVVMAMYWWLCSQWLRCVGDRSIQAERIIPILGILAAIFLVVYATALGSIGEAYKLQRRLGVTIFFAFTYLAQLLMASRLHRLTTSKQLSLPPYLPKLYIGMGLVLLLIGLSSAPLSLVSTQADNIVEWNFAILMFLYFVPTTILWHKTGFQFNLSLGTNIKNHSKEN